MDWGSLRFRGAGDAGAVLLNMRGGSSEIGGRDLRVVMPEVLVDHIPTTRLFIAFDPWWGFER